MAHNTQSPYEVTRTGGDGKGYGRVKPEDIALLQEKLFDTLSYFADFCEEHKIQYCMVGGTCLGAVRHKDFIPWDDDLDVAVLRADFDRLFRLWEEYGDKERFSLYRTTNDFCAYVPIGILRNNSTTFIRGFEKGLTDRILGVKIDIEPMDEIPAQPLKRRIQLIYAYLYVLFLTRRKALKEKKWRKIGTTILLGVIRSRKMRNAIMEFSGKQVRKYNGTGCKKVAINGLGYAQPITDFTESVYLPFHGKQFKVPARTDDYLSRAYGDYMALPPAEQRIPVDVPEYYDLNTPFEDYLKQQQS